MRVRPCRAEAPPLRGHARGGRRPALPRPLVRPRVPLGRRARHPVLRAELLPARLGRRRVLPARRRPGLRPAADGGRLRPACAPRGGARGRRRDGRGQRGLRAGRTRPRCAGAGRRRRPRLGGDDARARADLRARCAAHRLVARQPAPAGEVTGGAGRDGTRVPDRRARHGRGRAPRAARGHHGGTARGGRGAATARRLPDALVRDPHLHGHGSSQPRLRDSDGARSAPGRDAGPVRFRASSTATAPTSDARSSPASRPRGSSPPTT